MANKSFFLAAGAVGTGLLPFYRGVEGAAHLPQSGGCIIAANHSSFLDGPMLAMAYCQARLMPLHMIAYAEPFGNWLMGWVLRSANCIPFKRGDRDSQAEMMHTALGWLYAGEAVGIFPEGHINHRPLLNNPRPGAALLALESGRPLIPAAIIGTHRILPRGRKFPRLAPRAKVVFGPRIELLDKERMYRDLDQDEREMLIRNLGYRLMQSIGVMMGRKVRG